MRAFGEADFFDAHLVLKEFDDFLHLGRSGVPLDAGVDVFGIFAKDDHVGLLRMLHGGRDAVEVADRAEADVEVELLPQSDVQRTDSAADRRGQRSLDGDQVFADRIDGFAGKPELFAVNPVGFFTGEQLHPGDLPPAAVGLFDRAVPDPHRGGGDVGTDAVALDEADDRTIRNLKLSRRIGGHALACRNLDHFICHVCLLVDCFFADNDPVYYTAGAVRLQAGGVTNLRTFNRIRNPRLQFILRCGMI